MARVTERSATRAFADGPPGGGESAAGDGVGPLPSLLTDLRMYLDQCPALCANQVARRFGLSQRTLQRRLREFGTSLQKEINAAHLRIAKRLMHETNNSLKWIAIESGYASLQHFSSSFRARVGLSPSAWRAGTSSAKQAR